MKSRFIQKLNEDAYQEFGERVINEEHSFRTILTRLIQNIEENTGNNIPIDELVELLMSSYPLKNGEPSIMLINKSLEGYVNEGLYNEAILYLKELIRPFMNVSETYNDAASTRVIGESIFNFEKEKNNTDFEKGMGSVRRETEISTGTRDLLKPKVHKNKAKYTRKAKHRKPLI